MENIDKYHQFENVYETILGFREFEFSLPYVESAFKEGSPCDEKYEQMRQAYARICERLGAGDEDPDLDIIVNALESIQKEVCKEFYKLSIQLAEYALGNAYADEYVYRKLAAPLIRQKKVKKLKDERTGGFKKIM